MNIWYQKIYEELDQIIDQKYELPLINKIVRQTNLFRLIVSSLCPEIFGHQMIKSGLVLALFGGTDKLDNQSKQVMVRSQINVLLIGDHGSNKDILLKAVHSLSPKAQYICGNTSKLNFLTFNLKKHKTKDFFEKGCLVSKQFAICCIDEFERMDVRQHNAIQEVIERQTITIAVDNRSDEMVAKTAIIGAINPVNGFYDYSLNVWENTKLKKSILSIFDLIFVLVDTPDEEMDSILTKDIIDSRKLAENNTNSSQKKNMFSQNNDQKNQLMSKLVFKPEEEEPNLIPHYQLKQYILYAQQNINPVLNEEAADLLINFYEEFESSVISKSQIRDIESLYRLTEARARVELRPVATKDDVLDVIDIFRHSVGKHFYTPNVVHSIQTMLSFKNSKKSQNLKNLLKAMKTISEQNQQKMFSFEEIVEISHKFGIPFETRDDIFIAIERLNEQNFLLKTNSKYKLIN